jgi:uncharacterized small protein (DUF1192 family)
MTSDFEVHPVGTFDRIAKLEARVESLQEELEQQADGSSTIASLLRRQPGAVAATLIGMMSIQEAAARAVVSSSFNEEVNQKQTNLGSEMG